MLHNTYVIPLDNLKGVDWASPDVNKVFKFFNEQYNILNSRYDKVVQENEQLSNMPTF